MKNLQGIWRRIAGPQNPSEDESKVDRTRRGEIAGALDATLHGMATTVGPLLLFASLLGPQAVPAGLWATFITALLPPFVVLLLRGHPALVLGSRSASLLAYIGLVMLLGQAAGGANVPNAFLTAEQLAIGLAAGSFMFFAASSLVLLAGLLRMGNLFKMIPSTVSSGISNSIALLLAWLAFQQAMHNGWLAGLVAVAMFTSSSLWSAQIRRRPSLKWVPTVVVALLVGILIERIMEPALAAPAGASGLTLDWIAVRNWPLLLEQEGLGHLLMLSLPGTLTLSLVMILESLSSQAVMQQRFGLRAEANRQLLALAGANMVSALVGGVPCTGSPLRSLSNWSAGGRRTGAAVMGLAFTSATVFVLGNWLMAIPAGMIAGLFLMQVPLMVDPSTRSRLMEMISHQTLRKKGSSDLGFWIIVVISLAGFYGGLVWACFLGIGLSCLVVLRRVSSKLAAQWASLDRYQSRRVRSAGELATLGRLKHRVAVLRLTGHLFFGNSARLTQLMDELHRDTTTVLIDVSQVHDVDPSGLTALEMLIKALTGRQLQVILTGHRRSPSADLREGLQGLHKSVLNNTDLDRGLERAEDSVLLQATLLSAPLTRQEVADNALLQGFDEDELTAVLMLGEQREVSKGQPLFYRGDVADGIWMLQQGTVSILAGGLDSSRLATFGPGQFLGEMGMIDGKTRSATARADTPLLALHLDAQAIDALQEQHGVAALKIMRNIARELSLRVRATSAMMADESSEASVEWANSSLGPMSKF